MSWLEKHRPASLDDISGQNDNITVLRRLCDQNEVPHMIFYGPPGTGKTSTIHAIGHHLYGTKGKQGPMVLELNASDERGIDVVRDQIKAFASNESLSTIPGKVKLIILDEADAMTVPAQNALRRVMELYPRVRFCLIGNQVQKIIEPLHSRCTRFRFKPLAILDMTGHLSGIAAKEGISIHQEVATELTKRAEGDMRRAISTLQCCVEKKTQKVTKEALYAWTGLPLPENLKKLIKVVGESSLVEGVQAVEKFCCQLPCSIHTLVKEFHRGLIEEEILPPLGCVRAVLLEHLATLDEQIMQGGSERIQTHCFVSMFHVDRKAKSASTQCGRTDSLTMQEEDGGFLC